MDTNPASSDDQSPAETLSQQGTEHLIAGRNENAATAFQQALALDDTRVADWINLGYALWRLERPQEALECYDRALALDAQNPQAWLQRGNTLIKLGRSHEEVLENYDHALEFDSRLARAWYNKGDILGLMGRIIEAKACFENARDLGLPQAQEMVSYCENVLLNEFYG